VTEDESSITAGDASRWMAPMLVLFCGLVAYCNSLHGPFVFDDLDSIVENKQIQHVIPAWHSATKNSLAGRPVGLASFSLEYAIWQLDVEPYHAVNLLIHLGCGLLIFEIVRRTLTRRELCGDRFAGSATWLAAATAGIWVVHPLNTEAVTFIVQRVESLASLFYLGVIYCLIRRLDGGSWRWELAAVVSCALGMGTKEIVVTSPVMALLYDRTFAARSFAAALKKRGLLYAGLASTWILLGFMLMSNGRGDSAGFGHGLSSGQYAMTQLGVIAHYIRLAFWPRGQVFDEFNWPITHSIGEISLGGWLVLALALVSAVAVWVKPAAGFLGAWFFVLLSPSSSVVPVVTELAAEHRMYLALAAISTLVVLGIWELVRRNKPARWLAGAAAAAVIVALMGVTLHRNGKYSTAEALWRDTLAKRPNNGRAHYNLGDSLLDESKALPEGSDEAVATAAEASREFSACLRLSPTFHAARTKLTWSLSLAGMLNQAEKWFDQQLQTGPPEQIANAHFLRGTIRANRGDLAGARADFEADIAADPDDPEVHYLLGVVFQQMKQWKDAEAQFTRSLQLLPSGFRDTAKRLQDVRVSEALSTD
jgi:tetratricopeptide (TPR) repeat protein